MIRSALPAAALFLAGATAFGLCREAQAADHPALRCGVVVEQEDFNKSDTHGDLSAMGTAFCRALAAASDETLAETGYPDEAHALAALHEGRVDLAVGVTPDAARAQRLDLAYAPALFGDGQGFLLRRSLRIRDLVGLRDKVICYISETPMDAALVSGLARRQIPFRPHPFEETGEMEAALVGGSCDAITADRSALAAMRAGFHGQASAFIMLPETLTQDPYVPATRAADHALAARVGLVETMLNAAAEVGVTRVDAQGARPGEALTRLDRLYGTRGTALGFDPHWVSRVLAVSGNGREIVTAALGPDEQS